MNEQTLPEAEAGAEPVTQDAWRDTLRALGEAEGFYEDLGAEHTALFVERGKTLIVTFENLDHVFDRGADRMPWGYGFAEAHGWSMLGMMAHSWTWYRDEDVIAFFDRLREEGFFERFEKVVFYGASMGGYAAAAYSAAAPGATVICISPQATLRREDTAWETRYRGAWRRDFSGRYGYAPASVATAGPVHIFYDPRAPLDAMHAALFRSPNVTRYRCRFMGHRIASLWLQMGLLKPVVEACVDGSLTRHGFYAMMRARRDNPRYQREMLERLEDIGRPWLTKTYCSAVLERRKGPRFRRALRGANIALKKATARAGTAKRTRTPKEAGS